MEQFRCSEDNFDAIYICSNCTNMLCPKHYFSHQEKFPNHGIDHIKLPVNNESRLILINFAINYKKKLISFFHNIDFKLWAEYSEDDGFLLNRINELIRRLNLLILFVIKAQYIPMKIFYTPFEYFLHQPAEKAFKYATEFKFPENPSDFVDEPCQDNLFWFNYLNFEDKKYIFGWAFEGAYNNFRIDGVCITALCNFFLSSEYEMAYEALLNLKTILWINKEYVLFCNSMIEIIYNFIKKRKPSEIIEQWKYLETSLSTNKKLSTLLYLISAFLFKGLNQNELLFYCVSKSEITCKNQFPKLESIFKDWSPIWKMICGNFEPWMKYSKKNIILPKNYSRNDLKFWIISWILFLGRNTLSNEQINTVKIVKKINKVVESVENKYEFYELLCILNLVAWNFDDALKIAWKLLNWHKKNKIKLFLSEAWLYLYLGLIYLYNHDLKKAHTFLCNAKSCSGIIEQGILKAMIYFYLGLLYYIKKCFKDALYHFEYVDNSLNNWNAFKIVKIFIGLIHYYIQNYGKALKYFIEAEKMLIHMVPSEHMSWFSFYATIGELYDLKNNPEKANYYYEKTIEHMKSPGKFVCINDPTIDKVFSYFLKKYDEYKCKAILKLKINYLETQLCEKYISFKSFLCIQCWKLGCALNNIEIANRFLNEAEKLVSLRGGIAARTLNFRLRSQRSNKWLARA